MSIHLFIIGPGGVGKTTCSLSLGKRLGFKVIDLDSRFLEKFQAPPKYITENGYDNYCLLNSNLFEQLINENHNINYILVASSGLLTYQFNNLKNINKQLIEKNGISILLLPSRNIKEATNIVVKRQLNRPYGKINDPLKAKLEFIRRFKIYKKLGDMKIFSHDSPEKIADIILTKLAKINIK